MCESEEVLVPALPKTALVERGYITPQQVYNLLNAEEGQPALYDPYYMLILDCRSAERWVLYRHKTMYKQEIKATTVQWVVNPITGHCLKLL